MNYLLDSDMLIYFFNLQAPGYEVVSSLLTENEKVVVSILSVMEVRAGWSEADAKKFMPMLYDLFPVAQLTTRVAERAGQLRYRYSQQGRKPRPIDTAIAATALENNYCLITNNLKDYPMPELQLYHWS